MNDFIFHIISSVSIFTELEPISAVRVCKSQQSIHTHTLITEQITCFFFFRDHGGKPECLRQKSKKNTTFKLLCYCLCLKLVIYQKNKRTIQNAWVFHLSLERSWPQRGRGKWSHLAQTSHWQVNLKGQEFVLVSGSSVHSFHFTTQRKALPQCSVIR